MKSSADPLRAESDPQSKIINRLAIGFFFVFLPYHAVERHVGSFFEQSGSAALGLQLLAIAYGNLFLADFCSPIITSRLGYKKSLIVASGFYFLWIVSLVTRQLLIIQIASVTTGWAAALLWNSMASCVIREGDPQKTGVNFGKILSYYGAGAGFGLISISVLLSQFKMETAFLMLSPIVLWGLVQFSRLPDMGKPPLVLPSDLMKTYGNITILRVSSISMMTFLAFGLLVSVIPLQIEKILGIEAIGWLSSGSFFILALCYTFGRIVDEIGTRKLILTAYICLAGGVTALIITSNALWVIAGVICVCMSFAALFVVMLGLGELAPEHKIDSVQAVFTSADDITAFMVLAVSSWFSSAGIPLTHLYWATLGLTLLSLCAILPLFKGEKLEIAKQRLARDFPI